MICIPEGKRIQKNPGVMVLKPKDPRDAPIVGLVNAGFWPVADRQQERLAVVEGVDIAEIEIKGARDLSDGPRKSAVVRADERSRSPARPDDLRVHDSQTAQPGLGDAGPGRPLRGAHIANQQG